VQHGALFLSIKGEFDEQRNAIAKFLEPSLILLILEFADGDHQHLALIKGGQVTLQCRSVER